MSTIENQLSGKEHRTLLVIDARSGFSADQKDRVNRLLQSVNGNNIKVDIAHLTGEAGASVSGLALTQGLPSALGGSVEAPAINGSVYDEVVQAGKNLGYTQVLISTTP